MGSWFPTKKKREEEVIEFQPRSSRLDEEEVDLKKPIRRRFVEEDEEVVLMKKICWRRPVEEDEEESDLKKMGVCVIKTWD